MNIAGPVRNRRIVADEILEELAITYGRMAQSLIKANNNWRLKELKLLEFIDSINRISVRTSLREHLVELSGNTATIRKVGPTPTRNVRAMGETVPRVKISFGKILTC